MARKPALPEVPNASAMQRLGDLGLDIFAHTPVAMGEALVGLADIPTMGYAGKALEEIGYDPKTLHAMISRQMSEERQHEQAAQSEAYDESFWKGLGYSVTNPAPAIGTIIQSLPMMYGGRAIAQGLMKATPMLPAIAGGIGEGTIAGGMTLEQIRQDAEGGVLTPEQYALGLGAGAVTGGLGYLGGKLAGRLGLEDVDIPNLTPEKAIAEGARKSLARRIGEGAITEGVFEELPQSMQETVASNLALGKEWDEGLAESAGLGLLTGAAMGGAVQGKESVKAKVFNAMINKTKVEAEKVAAFEEAQQKFKEDKARAEQAHKEAVIDGKESADLLGDAPTLDEQKLGETIDNSQAEAAEAIQEVTAEAEELQEVVRLSTEESVENETANQIVEMLAPFKAKLNAGEEFEENIIFAARQDFTKKQFRDLLQSVYGSAGAVAADQIYPKLQEVMEGIAYEAEEAIRFHTEVDGKSDAEKAEILANQKEIVKIESGIKAILQSETYKTANKTTREAMDRQIENFQGRLNELKGQAQGKPVEGVRKTSTPEVITELAPNEVFVFGSNTEGRHGKGAAKTAKDKFGAKYGQAKGAQGQSYAIVTKDLKKGNRSVTLESITDQIIGLYRHAAKNPKKDFLMAKIGASLAGFEESEIKAAIQKAHDNTPAPENVVFPKGWAPQQAQDEEVAGIDISTKSTDPLGRALTNPVWGSKKDGKNYFDVETAYKKGQSLKTAKDLSPEEALRYDMNLMYKLQMEKFRRHPELIEEITNRGGTAFLEASKHTIGGKNSRWKGLGSESNFIKVLIKSYEASLKNTEEAPLPTEPEEMSDQDFLDYASVGEGEQRQEFTPQPITEHTDVIQTAEGGGIKFEESNQKGYAPRTKANASADVTIAIASDFNSAGEKLTKRLVKEQGKVYLPLNLKLNMSAKRVERIVKALNEAGAKTINIAGNGLHTLSKSGHSQADVDAYVYDLLSQVVNHPDLKIEISEVRSGGQTGIDEAGVKAAARLGLKARVLAPNGWVYRDAKGKDHKGKVNFLTRFRVMGKAEHKKARDQERVLKKHVERENTRVQDIDRPKALSGEEEAMQWDYFESEGMDPASMQFLDEQGNPIPFGDMGGFQSRQLEDGERGKIYVKPVLRDGTVLPERLVSEFDMRQHLKEKARAFPKQREIRSHEKAQAIDQMLLDAKIEETVPRDMDEETHEYLIEERAKEILQEGMLDGEPLGEKSIDAAKKKLALKKRKEGEAQLLEGEDVYHEGDIPAQPKEFIGEERTFDAESMDFFQKMRRFKKVKKLVDELAPNNKTLQKRIDALVSIMDNNPDLKGGYSVYIGEMLHKIAQTHDLKTVIEFVKTEEDILSIAELQGIPESLEDLMEFVNSGMKPYESEEEINNALTADELDMFIARVWTAVQRAVVDSEMLDDNRKAVARFVQDPRGAIKFVRDFFDYGATTVPDKITVKEMTQLARMYRKEFGAEIDIEVMAVLVHATKDQRLLDYLKDPEQKMRQFKGDHDVSGLYPYTPETPKVIPVEREKNVKTRKKLNKSAYQAFRDMTKTITAGTIDQSVVAGFYRALNKLANEGLSTKARFFDPVRIVGYMSNDPEVRKAFSVRKETKTASGKIIKQEVPFEERLKIVKELWKKSRIEYGTWTKKYVKEEAIGGLTAENIESIKSEGAMHVQDIDKEIKLRDESFEYKSMAETKNVTGYRTRTATVVESVTYKSFGTGASVTIKEPTPKQIEMVKERDPDYTVKTVDMPYMKPKEIKALEKTRVVTASKESQATGDAKVYQVRVGEGDPIDMSWPEIVRGRRNGTEIEILGDAAVYAIRVKNTKTGKWVGKKVRYDQLQFLKEKILEAQSKKTGVAIDKMTKEQVEKALDPYLKHIEYRGQQQIFPWDQSTLLAPLYDKGISQGVISMEDVGRQITKISYLKQINREITEAKDPENQREGELEGLFKMKNEISEQIAAFNVAVKSKLVVNDFVASMVVDPEYFERMAEAYDIEGKTAEDLFEIFVKNGYNIQTTTMQVEKMKRDQGMKEAHDLFLSKTKTPEAREKQIRDYVRARLPKSPTMQKLFDKVLDNRASITEVDDTFRSRQLFVAVQVYDLLDNAIGDRLVNRLGEDATANKIIEENWDRLDEAFSKAANLRHSAGQNVPEDMIFTDTDTGLREKRKLDKFEQELADQNPTMSIGRLMSKKAMAFYRSVAKAFGADLVIVSDTFYQSRYIAKASDGKAKIIVNIQSPTQFSRIFGHELFHHVVAKAAPNEYKAFRKAVIEVVTQTNPDGTAENYGAWVSVVEQMMRRRGIEYKDNEGSVPFADLIEYLSEKGISEEEIMAEIFASMVHDKGFYEALAKTFAGKGLAARMIVHLIEKVEEVAKIALRTYEGQPLYENGLLLNQDQLKQMHELFADFVGNTMLSTAPITAEYTRMHTSFGRKTVNDLTERLADKKSWFQGSWKKIFPEGTKNRKEVMSQLEKHMQASVDWMKKMKPKVMWADWMADRMSLKYMNLIAHGQSKQVAKVRYGVIQKHKKAFKNMTTEEKMAFHDLFVKGLHTRYVYKDANGDKQTVLKKADIPYGFKSTTVVTEVGFADVNTPEGRERYNKFGYSDEIIDAMIDFKKVADEVFAELKKIYPDLEKHDFHYGQSIKWYRKDGVELDYKYDWDSSPDHSFLEGRKQFLKGKNMEMTTDQIAQEKNLEYLHVDPDRMLLDYIHDSYKLIYFKKALGQAMQNGHAKIFYIANQGMAAEKGYFPVNDGALRIIQNMAMPHGTKIIIGDPSKGEAHQDEETGQDAIFETDAEALRVIEKLKTRNPGERYTTERIAFDRNTIVTGYRIVMKKPSGEIKMLPKQYRFDGTEYEDAQEALVELQRKQDEWLEEQLSADPNSTLNAGNLPTFHIETIEKAGDGDKVARVYFKEDMANMLNNLLAEDLIRNRAFFGLQGRKVMDLKNQYTSIEFAISLFHAMTIGQELVASNAAWAYGRMRQDGVKGAKEVLKSYNPVVALREAREIAALMEAVLADTKLAQDPAIKKKAQQLFRTESADVLDAIIQFYDAGGLTGMDKSLRSHVHYEGEMRYKDGEAKVEVINGEVKITLPKGDRIPAWVPGPFTHGPISRKAITESFRGVWQAQIKEHPDHPLTAAFKTGKFALMEGTTAWLMEQGIPRIKMAMWAKEYTLELDQQKDAIESGDTNKEFIARNTMKFIEDRFGEVNWVNTWMNPTYKTALQFAFRSFTWFTGSWNALAKAGIDVGKLGWFKLKGEEYQLTSRGLWAMNAIVAHLMAAGLIYSMFAFASLMAGGATDDEEEIPLITKLLFPRVDPLNPEKRVSIPSYVTEWYKLLRHLGIIGTHMELHKLISGRFNSLLGKSIDLYTNQDFRGVAIRNDADGAVGQLFDSLMHLAPLPISVSSAKKNWETKGFDPVDFMFSGLGMVDAPAAAKRSTAANLAFEIRRREYKGREITAEEMELKDEVKRAAYAFGQGDKKPLREMLSDKKISKKQYDNALKRIPRIGGKKNPFYQDPLTSAMRGLTIVGAMEVWEKMSDAEKKRHKPTILKKYQNMVHRGYRSGEYKKEIRERMKELKILK